MDIDAVVKSQKSSVLVIPAKAVIQENQWLMDPRFREGGGLGDFLRDHQYYKRPKKIADEFTLYRK